MGRLSRIQMLGSIKSQFVIHGHPFKARSLIGFCALLQLHSAL